MSRLAEDASEGDVRLISQERVEAGITHTARTARPFITRTWHAALILIAAVAWWLAWLIHRGMASPIHVNDLGTRAFVVGSAAFLLWLLVKVPEWQTGRLPGSDRDRFAAENEARRTLAQVIGGVGLIGGLYFTGLQVRQTQQSAAASERLTRDGQITDRYIKAVEELGTDTRNQSSKIGAIYALERIARESQVDHWPIMELLASYVRQRSAVGLSEQEMERLRPAKSRARLAHGELFSTTKDTSQRQLILYRTAYFNQSAWVDEPASEDVRAALTVIGRRTIEYEAHDDRRLNLRGANLSRINLRGAHLEGADLGSANLMFANLAGACLNGAELRNALLLFSNLERADLRRSDLAGAVWRRGSSTGLDLRQSYLVGLDPFLMRIATGRKYLDVEGADATDAIVDLGPDFAPVPGARQASRDWRKPLPNLPYPPRKDRDDCIPRSAEVWLQKPATVK